MVGERRFREPQQPEERSPHGLRWSQVQRGLVGIEAVLVNVKVLVLNM